MFGSVEFGGLLGAQGMYGTMADSLRGLCEFSYVMVQCGFVSRVVSSWKEYRV
jgi:hypothetical protein